MTKTPAYLNALTPMRGLAALWVVLFHIDVSIYYRELGALLPREETGIIAQGYLWVDFFFLLSGFIITHVYGNTLTQQPGLQTIRSFLWARFTRLYPLHLVTTLVLVLIALCIPKYLPQLIDGSWHSFMNWKMLPLHLLMVNAMTNYHALSWNIPAWSIGAEWVTYMLSLGLFPLFYQRGRRVMIVSLGLSAIALVSLVYLHPTQSLDITYDLGVLRCLFEFILGTGLYHFYQKRTGAPLLQEDVTGILILIFIALSFHFHLPDLLLLPLFSLLILAIAYNQSRLHRLLEKPLLRYLGDISYSIYLVHGIWFSIFWFTLPILKESYQIDTLSPLWRLTYIFVFMILTLGTAHLTYHQVELKARSWLRRWPIDRGGEKAAQKGAS